jgi:uncharacterized membrane protein SpoIIM required for sporulation/ABC-type transport system involved in multi-copper enzyme maturation permease subunit
MMSGTFLVVRRELQDQLRDWRILTPILLLTLFFPLLMNFTAQRAVDFVGRYGAEIVGDRLIPFLLMVVGFFPISISLVIALESFAGERERLSLEPLFATPLTDSQLYFGKILASLIAPLSAAYLGITVYLVGLYFQIGWVAEPQLLIQIVLLTTAQAIVMVTGAVVISSQTTSVRAANLLASFIIVPVSQLIIGESMIMFWGRYHILWWSVVGLILLAVVMARMGLHLFNREELLGRELDILDLNWVWKTFWSEFNGGASNSIRWVVGVWSTSLRHLFPTLMIMILGLTIGYVIGYDQADTFQLPTEVFEQGLIPSDFTEQLSNFGFLSGRGLLLVFYHNLRALVIASVLGAFSFGILSVILLIAPIGLIGYFAGNLSLAGQNTISYLIGLVLPHGILEIPATIIAGAAILRLGMAAVSLPRGSSLGESWLAAFAGWARVMIGIVIPLLICAAFLEVFVTPRVAELLLGG